DRAADVLPIRRIVIACFMGAPDEETRCGDKRTGSNDEHPDTIDSRADDFHELSKILHERLSCPKTLGFSILFLRMRSGMRARRFAHYASRTTHATAYFSVWMR